MTGDMKNDGHEPDTAAPANATPEAGPSAANPEAAPGAGTSGGGESPAPSDVIAQLKVEAAELRDRLLRTHAEMDNVRKRLEREKLDASRFAITKFARDVLGIGDNVQRAIDVAPHKAAEADPTLKSFVDGVTMIERELVSVLERHGVKRVDPKGEAFDPHFHQAVVEVPSPDVPTGTITQVFQSGYMIEERVLRPAMVAVARGGMKPAGQTGAAQAAAGTGQAAGAAPGGEAPGGQPSGTGTQPGGETQNNAEKTPPGADNDTGPASGQTS